jgi:hypothetical protein
MNLRITACLFALGLVLPLASACTTSTEDGSDDTSTDESELVIGKRSCKSVGGTCVGLSPTSCTNGRFADASKVSCGRGVGVACCVPAPVCPVLSPPAPGFCTNGTITPKKGANGCITGYECVPPPPPPPPNACVTKGGECVGISPTSCRLGLWGDASTHSCGGGVGVGCCLPKPPAPTACETKGGECVGISPTSCRLGLWGDASTHSCGGGVGVGCCLPKPACPEITPPSPSFCPGGTVKPRIEQGCILGYDCVPAPNACIAQGGSCVGLSPSSCPSGNWGPASACGTGIGVGCCLP